MTGIEVIRNPDTTEEQIATVISGHCPPVVPEDCDHLACRDCWLAWLTQEQSAKERMVCHIIRGAELPQKAMTYANLEGRAVEYGRD